MIFIVGGQKAFTSALLIIPVGAGAFRAFQGGWRPNKDVKQEDGILIVLANLVFLTLLWPVFEILRQLRFLWRASRAWPKGEILVDDKERPIRAA